MIAIDWRSKTKYTWPDVSWNVADIPVNTTAEDMVLYTMGTLSPNYPMPAIRTRSFEYWRNLGEVSVLNNFDIEVVQRLNRYR